MTYSKQVRTRNWEEGRWITAIVAHHSRYPQIANTLGSGNGYWIELSNGDRQRTMYWTGDPMPTRDVIDSIRSLSETSIRQKIDLERLHRPATPGLATLYPPPETVRDARGITRELVGEDQ